MSKEDSSEGKSHASTPDTSPLEVPAKNPNAKIYENRGPKKIIRVVTVMAYLFSVSFVGILLSAYYIFLWEPPNPRLIQRERLQMDPQLQFLIALPTEKTELMKENSSLLLQSEVDHVHKPFSGRTTQDMYDGDDSAVDLQSKINFQKKRRLNAILRNLRHSLVSVQRARNLSQEAAITSGFNNSFDKVEKVLNSTMGRADYISEEKTRSDNADLPIEFADSVSTLSVESTPSTSKFMTIPGTETSQRYFHRDSITNANSIMEEKNRYYKKKLDVVESYLVPEFSNTTTNSDVTNSSRRRDFRDNSSSKVIQKFLKIIRKESMKPNETNDRRLINNRKNDPINVQTSVMLNERVNGSIRNSQKNYFSDESFSKDQIGQIARDRVSIDSPSRDSGFHQTPDDPNVVKSRLRTMGTRNSKGERIYANLPAFLTTSR